MNIDTYAAEYFAIHLECNFWDGLDLATRQACLKMAAADIAGRLGRSEPDPDSIPQMNAVCEQAVFLARYNTRINQPFDVESEELNSVGRRSFRTHAVPEISRRALMFIRQAANGGNGIARG